MNLSGRVALSVDGSFLLVDVTAAAGMILRRPDESVIFAVHSFLFNYNDALEVGIHVLMEGMALAIQHSKEPGVVQSDSSKALATLSGEGLLRSAYDHLVSSFLRGGFIEISL